MSMDQPASLSTGYLTDARQVEVYTLLKRQGANRYGKPRIFKAGQSVPVVIEGVDVGRIAVADILPRDPSGHRQAP